MKRVRWDLEFKAWLSKQKTYNTGKCANRHVDKLIKTCTHAPLRMSRHRMRLIENKEKKGRQAHGEEAKHMDKNTCTPKQQTHLFIKPSVPPSMHLKAGHKSGTEDSNIHHTSIPI